MNDPEKIKQIMDIAESMGVSAQIPDVQTQELPQQMIQQVSHVFQKTETKTKQQQTLIRALLPYLNPKRQARLERAMQLSQISRLAGAAIRNGTAVYPSAQEDDIHV